MPPVVPIIIPNGTSYNQQYNIQLCQTLDTKSEIRECLLANAEEYKRQQSDYDFMFGGIIVFIIALPCLLCWWYSR